MESHLDQMQYLLVSMQCHFNSRIQSKLNSTYPSYPLCNERFIQRDRILGNNHIMTGSRDEPNYVIEDRPQI